MTTPIPTRPETDLQRRARLENALPFVLREAQRALAEAGPWWVPTTDISLVPGGRKPFELRLAGLKRIEMRVEPTLLLKRASAAPPLAANPSECIGQMVRASVSLFAGYFDICPWDPRRHARLVDRAVWGAYRTYGPDKKQQQVAAAVVSFFERCVVAHALTETLGERFVRGLAYEKIVNQHPPHLLSNLWARLMVLVFPKAWSPTLAVSPLEPDAVADALLPKAMALLFGVQARPMNGRIRIFGRPTRPPSWSWGAKVEALAELLAPHVEQAPNVPQPVDPPFPPAPVPGPGPGPTPDVGLPVTGEGLDGADTVPSPFDIPGDLNPFRDEIWRPGGPLPSGLAGPDRYNNFEEIDRFYSQAARSLVVRDAVEEVGEEKPEVIPVGHMAAEKAEPLDLALGRIRLFDARPVEPCPENPIGIEFSRPAEPLEIPAAPLDPRGSGLPNLLLVVDSSGSMSFKRSPDGKFSGQYHLALLGCWGIFRYIEEQNAGENIWACSLNFSNTTRSSDWHPLGALEPVKRNLAAFQGHGTRLDPAVLRRAAGSCPGEFLAVVVTDGGLGNTAEALDELRKTMVAGNRVVQLHIGAENAFTTGIRAMGGTVNIINKPEDLVDLCIGLAKQHYGEKSRIDEAATAT